MKPVKFEDANGELTAPGCDKLPVIKTRDNCIVSCWEMSDKEKKEFEKTGKIWLSVISLKHPPVCLSVEQPYVMATGEEKHEHELEKNK